MMTPDALSKIPFGLICLSLGAALLLGWGDSATAPTSPGTSPKLSTPPSPLPLADAISRGPLPDETGTIEELIPAGPYVYIAYSTPKGEARWGASLKTSLKLGEAVNFIRYAYVDDFESKRLGRRFDRLFFVRVQPLPPERP